MKTIFCTCYYASKKYRIPSYNNKNQNANFIENPTIGRKYIKVGEGQRHIDGTHMKHVFFL